MSSPDSTSFYPPDSEFTQSFDDFQTLNSELKQPFLSDRTPKQAGDYDKYVFTVPQQFEDFFGKFDDAIIKWLQSIAIRPVVWLCVAITALTAIEASIPIPFILYALGLDSIATHILWLVITLMFVSQLPKRFLWRSRPHMVGRAKKIRKDKTSSFPSRAVTCAVVYSYGCMFSIQYAWLNRDSDGFNFHWWTIFPVIAAAIIASIARITVGAHYPSDCIFGFFQGILVCTVGTLMYYLFTLMCPSCKLDECYAQDDTLITLSYRTFAPKINWVLLVCSSLFFFLLAFLSVIKPLQFWVKCHYVYGLLFPPLVFDMLFLCPNLVIGRDAALPPPPNPPSWYTFIYAFVVGGALVGAGMASKKYPLISFSALFTVAFLCLSLYRLGNI